MNGQEANPDFNNETAVKAYYDDSLERIKAGERVWMQRNHRLSVTGGRVLDLYVQKKHVGSVEDDNGSIAYVNGQGAITPLTDFETAVSALEAHAEQTR